MTHGDEFPNPYSYTNLGTIYSGTCVTAFRRDKR